MVLSREAQYMLDCYTAKGYDREAQKSPGLLGSYHLQIADRRLNEKTIEL